jgi:cellulose synthase operon protein YhjQ
MVKSMKTVAIVSAKGGVGKSTITANLGVALQQLGQPAVLVDLDPQNALRLHLGAESESGINGLARASVAGTHWRDICVRGDSGVHVLPYGQVNENDRETLEQQMREQPDWLAKHLQALGLGASGVVLLDTPPGPSVYLRQALSCADLVLVVTLADAASFATLPLMEGMIEQYCEQRPEFLGHAYVLNQVDNSASLSKDAQRVVTGRLGDRVVGAVHRDVAVAEALAFGKSVVEVTPYSQASHDLLMAGQWLLQQLQSAETAHE